MKSVYYHRSQGELAFDMVTKVRYRNYHALDGPGVCSLPFHSNKEEILVIQTLTDVIEHHQELLAQMDRANPKGRPMRFYDTSEMEGVVVLPDAVALRFLEINYVFGTHFVPGGLPGVGESTADFLEREGKNYLALSLGVLMWNVAAFHLVRREEELYRRWYRECRPLADRVQNFLAQVKAADSDCFGLGVLKEPERWNESYVGWSYLGTPTPAFIQALNELTQKPHQEIAREARSLTEAVKPYAILHELMIKIRKEAHHKGFPRIYDDMLVLNTPAASGGASLHTHHASDDLRDAVPSQNDLLILAAQAGTIAAGHLGGGKLQGECYIMLLPRASFFECVQAEVEASQSLRTRWLELTQADVEVSKAAWNWTAATREIKERVIADIVPDLVAHRVLGFHIDLISGKDHRIAKVKPVVAESLLHEHKELPEQHGWSIERRDIAAQLVDTGEHYVQFKSVFDSPA